MELIIGCDHAALSLKETIKAHLINKGIKVHDVGTFTPESMNYPDTGMQVASAVSKGAYERGILLCGTGLGMSMVANRYPHVRAALCKRSVRCKHEPKAQQRQYPGFGRPCNR